MYNGGDGRNSDGKVKVISRIVRMMIIMAMMMVILMITFTAEEQYGNCTLNENIFIGCVFF